MVVPKGKTSEREKKSYRAIIYTETILCSLVAGVVGGTIFGGRVVYDAVKGFLPPATYQLKKENVLGSALPEEFYEINGKRFYLSIDGKAIEELYKPNPVEKEQR
jgi:hypothetical protein